MRVLSRLFRRLFLQALEAAFHVGKLQWFGELEALRDAATFAAYLAPLRATEWVVYAKPPFGGPAQVLAYLGRYTHRVAISNQRLLAAQDGTVTFQWKDYRHTEDFHSAGRFNPHNPASRCGLVHRAISSLSRRRNLSVPPNLCAAKLMRSLTDTRTGIPQARDSMCLIAGQ